jgi:hypothetical protein
MSINNWPTKPACYETQAEHCPWYCLISKVLNILVNKWRFLNYLGATLSRTTTLLRFVIISSEERSEQCFSLWWKAPQQMLRTHRSLEAYCATLWRRWREWWSVFFIFPSNLAPVEWNWQGKTEILGEKPLPVPLCRPQIPHGLTRDRTRSSAVRGGD